MNETAASHLVRRVPTGAPDERAGDALSALVGRELEAADAVCVLDEGGRLLGLVDMATLVGAASDRPLRELMWTAPSVSLDADQESVATIAIRSELADVPVVDGDGRFAGVVPARAILRILRHEHVEDLHRLAGIQRESDQARDALEAPPTRRARARLPWLLVGLAGSALATWVMSRFERALESQVVIAFFVPAIVYLADAIGTQTEAIAVRGLSFSHFTIGRLVAGELRTGAIIGAVLGTLAFVGVWATFGDPRLAVAVGLSILAAGATATGVGLFFPWILARAGRDPAYGSGPVATIVQDVLSILVYFAIVTALMRP